MCFLLYLIKGIIIIVYCGLQENIHLKQCLYFPLCWNRIIQYCLKELDVPHLSRVPAMFSSVIFYIYALTRSAVPPAGDLFIKSTKIQQVKAAYRPLQTKRTYIHAIIYETFGKTLLTGP